MTGPHDPPTPVPGAGSDRALFDAHYAGVLATEARAPRGAARGGGGGGFTIDPDGYRVAIDELNQAIDELEAGQQRWGRTASDRPIGIDPVSIQLRINMDEMRRRAMEWVRIYTGQVRDARDALAAQLASYEATERANVKRLT
ncbi:MAG: hypothetical protein ACT4RN_03275 [Pseudonocardia sp.]